ncbi:hypothetical protein K1719_028436 [Acacia pycnantha]|nr:hypothetical protein K1719_028436 [Acacia pycnantha]
MQRNHLLLGNLTELSGKQSTPTEKVNIDRIISRYEDNESSDHKPYCEELSCETKLFIDPNDDEVAEAKRIVMGI